MKRPGPLLTLLSGLVFALVLLVLDTTTGTRDASSADRGARPSGSPAAASPAPVPSAPSPSATATAAAQTDYTGRTDDDAAAVAVSVRGRKAIAYYCDGRTRESWLRGDVADDGSLHLTGEGGTRLDGTLTAGVRVRGTVDAGGRHAFTAERSARPSRLWRTTATVRSARIDSGWIVLRDGSQVGVLTRDGVPEAAPPIDPGTGAVTLDGRRLTARPVSP
ncbi:hypothetical protein [Streptomyces sp. bgisy154]|uniref:hypothetical protein n=1 Tax=Streptomyces sp. bgisy154 TaxID=3413794 RepID=UPI003D707897